MLDAQKGFNYKCFCGWWLEWGCNPPVCLCVHLEGGAKGLRIPQQINFYLFLVKILVYIKI